jgi:hypothetical protein
MASLPSCSSPTLPQKRYASQWSARTSVNIADSLASGYALGPFNDMPMIVWAYDGVIGNGVMLVQPSVKSPETYIQPILRLCMLYLYFFPTYDLLNEIEFSLRYTDLVVRAHPVVLFVRRVISTQLTLNPFNTLTQKCRWEARPQYS